MGEDPTSWRNERVASALRGSDPTVLRRLRAGFAVIGDVQHFPGYCLLITDDPDVSSLTDLPAAQQDLFLADAALLARAVERVARRRDPAYRRINVEVQGNTDAFLHAHVTPRYGWEPQPHVRWPAGVTWWDGIPDPEVSALGVQHDELRAEITAAIDSEVAAAGVAEGSIAGALADPSKNAPAQGVIPILRVFDAAQAREFYVDVLGFVWEWQHQFEPGFPVYAQVAREGRVLHLTEHHGDATPGGAAMIVVADLSTYRDQLLPRQHRQARPDIEENPWGRIMTVVDPFGNRLIFWQRD